MHLNNENNLLYPFHLILPGGNISTTDLENCDASQMSLRKCKKEEEILFEIKKKIFSKKPRILFSFEAFHRSCTLHWRREGPGEKKSNVRAVQSKCKLSRLKNNIFSVIFSSFSIRIFSFPVIICSKWRYGVRYKAKNVKEKTLKNSKVMWKLTTCYALKKTRENQGVNTIVNFILWYS